MIVASGALVFIRRRSGVAPAAAHGDTHTLTSQGVRRFRAPVGTRNRQYPILGYSQVLLSAIGVDKTIYSAEYQQLCALLRELRKEAGLTQVQVAERLDEPQSFVSKYEAGERRLDVIELRHVAQAIGINLRAILDHLDPLEPK